MMFDSLFIAFHKSLGLDGLSNCVHLLISDVQVFCLESEAHEPAFL